MVAHLLRLRLLLLKNSLLRSAWQLVAVIIGALYGIGLLVGAVGGLFELRTAPVELARTIVVIAGSALIVGWILLPLAVSGIDQAIDPARLAPFPLSRTQLLVGLTLCGVLGIPGVVTLLVSLATAGTWWLRPPAAVAAVICGVIATLTCVVASRAVTSLSNAFSAGRRFREVAAFVAFVALALIGPLLITLGSGVRVSLGALPRYAEALAWSPIGAVWAVPADVAVADYPGAILKLLIAVSTLALLVLLWRRSLVIALVTPARRTTKTRARGRIGLLGMVPATPAGATMARSLVYWLHDPRYTRQLLIVPVGIGLMLFYSLNGYGGLPVMLGPVVAVVLSLSIFSDISFDGSAFALQVASGMRGRDDRTGRAAALASFGLPIVALLSVASSWITSHWLILPALLGLSFGIFLSGLALSSVSSARVVLPVSAAGENPFKAAPGAGFTGAVTTCVTWGILGVLVLPEIALFTIASVTGSPLVGWVTLAVGLFFGSVLLAAGIRFGGAQLDRRSPELLQKLMMQR